MSSARLAVIFIVLAACGCSRLAKTRECQSLSKRVNLMFDSIERETKGGAVEGFRKASSMYRALAVDLRKQGLSAPNGKPLVEELASVLDSSAGAAEGYASALGSKDPRRIEDARRELERLAHHEQGLALRLNGYCEAP